MLSEHTNAIIKKKTHRNDKSCTAVALGTGSVRHPAGVSIQPSFGGTEDARVGGGGDLGVRDVAVFHAKAVETH